MNMRATWILMIALAVAGCATQRPAARSSAKGPALATKPVVNQAAFTRVVETRYELRGYRDADNPAVRHEAHAVYRTTRVPTRGGEVASDTLETVPRAEFAPASYAPLPRSAELAAEVVTQKEITEQLRAIQAAMAATEKQAQRQYGTLVNETAETIKLRRELEAERARVKELEASLRDRAADLPPVASSATAQNTTATRW
jgi:hypothetical protein